MKVLEILPPSQKHKKYKALVVINGEQKMIHFGDSRYQHYKDTTPLKHWSHLNHNDLERRKQYHIRHKNNNGPAGILAREFLW